MLHNKKFALLMRDGVEVHDLDELRNSFEDERAMEYFCNGKLATWLSDRYYEDEAAAIEAIDVSDPNAMEKIRSVLGVESVARVEEKAAALKALTDDVKIIANARITALNQEDLAELLDHDEPLIYLCGKAFTIPIRLTNKKYVGIINAPKINIRAASQADLDAKKIVFENVILPWSGSDVDSSNVDNNAAEVCEATTVVSNLTGIHARTASIVAQKASNFESSIKIKANGKIGDAKKIVELLSMGIIYGTEVTIVAEGSDAQLAVKEMKALIDAQFGEEYYD